MQEEGCRGTVRREIVVDKDIKSMRGSGRRRGRRAGYTAKKGDRKC